MIKNLICIQCPRGCHLTIDTETKEVSGNFCPRGKIYAINEVTDPKRTITSTIKVKDGDLPRCSVKTSDQVKKTLIFKIMDEINKVEVEAPIHINQVIIKNVLDTGVDIISTKEIKKI